MNEISSPDVQAASSSSRGFSYLYMMAAFVVVVAGMRAAESIINPLLLAIFLAVLSAPAYFGLLKRNVPNWLALLTVVGVLTGLVLAVLWIVLGSIVSFSSRQEHYAELLKERTASITKPIDRWLMEDEVGALPAIDEAAEVVVDPLGKLGLPATNDDSAVNEQRQDEASPSSTDLAELTTSEPDASEPDTSEPDTSETSTAETVEGATWFSDSDGPSETAANENGVQLLKRSPDTPALDVLNSESANVNQTFGFPQRRGPPPKDKKGWEKLMSNQFNPRMLISLTLAVMTELGQILSNAFLILLTVIFILLEVNTFRRKIGDAFTKDEEMAVRASQVVTSIQHYIVIKTWVSLGTGIFITIWLKFLGVPYAGLWGLLSFLFNFIPNIGSIIAAVPAVLIAWLELSTLPAFAAAFGFVLVNGVLGNFLEPKWMGKGLGLSPLVVFCSLVFWGWVLGPVGMLLSVPLTKTLRIALDGFDDTRFVATLLSD
ncbi:MAG: AI-2E family transporter [Fuerstiella sp.]